MGIYLLALTPLTREGDANLHITFNLPKISPSSLLLEKAINPPPLTRSVFSLLLFLHIVAAITFAHFTFFLFSCAI